MAEQWSCDVCVIGAGSGGLSVAAGASQMGADVVLLEKGRMGGDCLNTGCVPSKALLAAAHAAESVRRAGRFGVLGASTFGIDSQRVQDHVRATIDAIAPHDSVERFESLGVRVIQQAGRFVDEQTVQAGQIRIRARRFVIATGSRPAIPAIPGLDATPYFTNENLFENAAPTPRLLVIGGGPIGVEMAQAYRRLGAEVTLLVRSRLLPKEDPELVDVARQALRAEGVDIREGVTVKHARESHGGVELEILQNGAPSTLQGSHLLVATGRAPNVEGLGLEKARLSHSHRGVHVDARLRTSAPHIYAIGDVINGPLFTHAAGYHAGIVIRNILFRLPAKADAAIPRVTYCDPELAHVGLSEAEAAARGQSYRVLRKPFAENDRARAEGRTAGLIKVVLGKRGHILGASLVGPHAGELIQPWILAITQKMKIGAMAGYIAPYPTLGEINKGVAGAAFTSALYSPTMRKWVRWLMKLG
ncbi:dihydrolipoyl dehydrogenase family protein [Magnetofaba australis]|uniref:Putative mercuric reductase n=1 Tax=Magnetofaba australis IT-1 TaxID=1434232 RepID=A0A1Y2JYX4_9PROT|nr:FAD-dependent oxidoreductase [Magnetofaba australis]OSM00095.1 putative mercuric reductase [Magnetofaba australis IT-1]